MGSGLHVLLADDNALSRLLARRLLTRHGIRVTEATNGAEALALVRTQVFDVVLLDIQMPVMDGLTATAAIRALPDPARGHVPIVALTGEARPETLVSYLAAGMSGCLTKPLDEDLLLELLAALTRPGGISNAAATPASTVSSAPTGAPAVFPATALRLGHGSQVFVRQLVVDFLTEAPALLGRLTTAAAAEAAAIAHQLLPAARMFDAAEAALALARLEATATTKQPAWEDVRAYALQETTALADTLRAWLAASTG